MTAKANLITIEAFAAHHLKSIKFGQDVSRR
jgi:hypothetical protein